jgi:hypothetical protein
LDPIKPLDLKEGIGMGFMDSLKGIVKASPGVTPLGKEVLIEKLIAVNHEKLPFRIQAGEDVDLVAEWKIVDASWYEIFAGAKMEKSHKILINLDEAEQTARVLEESYSVQWKAGIPSISMKVEKFQGRTLGSKSFGTGYAFKGVDPLSFGQVYQYRFDVSEMKNPIIEIVTGSGWDFVPVVSKKKL